MALKKPLKTIRNLWHMARRNAVSVFFMTLTGYLAAQLIGGDHGMLRQRELQAEKEEAQHTLALVMEERLKLEHRVARMRSESLDPDLVEEQAKAMLGLVGPDERVIMVDEEKEEK